MWYVYFVGDIAKGDLEMEKFKIPNADRIQDCNCYNHSGSSGSRTTAGLN